MVGQTSPVPVLLPSITLAERRAQHGRRDRWPPAGRPDHRPDISAPSPPSGARSLDRPPCDWGRLQSI